MPLESFWNFERTGHAAKIPPYPPGTIINDRQWFEKGDADYRPPRPLSLPPTYMAAAVDLMNDALEYAKSSREQAEERYLSGDDATEGRSETR